MDKLVEVGFTDVENAVEDTEPVVRPWLLLSVEKVVLLSVEAEDVKD